MHLMYVDESGDCGLVNSPTRFFVLSGLVVHELRWHDTLDRFIAFRQAMKAKFGLKLREEIHAGNFFTRPGKLSRIMRNDRLTIVRSLADELAGMADLNFIHVLVDKQGKPLTYDVFEMGWKALIQRFENTITHRNFPGPQNADERGLILPDHTDDKKLTGLLRKMRRYNVVPSKGALGLGARNLTLTKVIEDPNFKDSDHSYFIQAADAAAFMLYQLHAPNSYIRKRGARNYFLRLAPVLCRYAAPGDPQGVVRL